VTAQKNIEFTRVSQEVFGKPGEGPAAAPLAGRAFDGRACYGAAAAVAALVASGAAASVAAWGNSGYARPGGGVRPGHPTPTGRPRYRGDLHYAADHEGR
jgi:hypothetical protein